MTFRTVVKEISLERGIHASFMPKPLSDAPGSGMHTHLSLFEGDANAFYEAGQEFNMSVTARQFAYSFGRYFFSSKGVTCLRYSSHS